ncbi:MAG TPA: ABC transporter permease [Gemmataceae bacterium]|nr:ABC transporter permease [Gemmataceae bacterium]
MSGRYQREWSVAVAYGVLLGTLAIAAPAFYTGDKVRTILVGSAPVLVAAVGMTAVIVTRQIDISIGSQFSICGVAAGLLAQAGVPMPVVMLGSLLLGAGLGAVNGVLVAGLGLPSIVVTLATMVTLREGLRWYQQGEFVRNLPPSFQWFGLGQSAGQWLIIAAALGIWLVGTWGLRYVAGGRAFYAVGSDLEAARLVGIRPRRIVFAVFLLMGVLTGLAALLHATRFADVDPNAGLGLELQVIAAVVVGGTAISGGRGTLAGTLIGVALLATIGPALVFLGTEAHWEKAIQGTIILVAVAADTFPGKRRRHAPTSLVKP